MLRIARRFATERNLKAYPIRKEINGFTIEKVLPVPELALTAVLLNHSAGGQHLHIDRKDKNNVFSVAFKTNPPDKTGVPHILEHTTLCGSEKYPVRDPFFKMLNRSLSNFMNAMTGHDYTFYPFATTNSRDFENLQDVYLDAVFHPLLQETDFQQEGWRLENAVTKDEKSPLEFKGVVYNEMKGQISNSQYLFWIKFQQSLYPSLENSGGDPEHMTKLTYYDLLEFHRQNYHPSNAFTFSYGDLPLHRSLVKLAEVYKVFGKRAGQTSTKKPPQLSGKTIETTGPVDPTLSADAQIKKSITWQCGDPKDTYLTFKLKFLSSLLMDGHSAPLYTALIDSGLGSDYSVNSGLESMTACNFFTVGLQGLKEKEADQLQGTVDRVLRESLENGFPESRIDAMVHQLEISRKTESAEFGLGILSSVVPGWVNGVDPLRYLAWNDTMDKFHREYSEKKSLVFCDLIKRYLLVNPFVFSMKPDPLFEESLAKEEQVRLKEKVQALDEQDRKIIYDRGLVLEAKQNEKEDLSCLPALSVSDIPRDEPTKRVDVAESAYRRLSSKTNGLTFFRALKEINIPEHLLPFLPLFCECLTNLGTRFKTMADVEDEIKLYTGGLSSSVSVSASPYNINEPRLKWSISGSCLDQNFGKLVSIWEELLVETNFRNLEKLSVLIKGICSDNINSVVDSGHAYARLYSASKISPVKMLDDKLNGVEQVLFLSKLNKWNETNQLENMVIPQLEQLSRILVSQSGWRTMLTCDRKVVNNNEKAVSSFINRLPQGEPSSGLITTNLSASLNTLVKIPAQVSFSSLTKPGVSYAEPEGAFLQVLSQLLTFKRLHQEVREKGGAYGGGASYDGLSGVFGFYSYRDPNALRSVDVFRSSGAWILEALKSGELTEEDLDQAKLTIFQRVDAPMSVQSEGVNFFVNGVDDEMRQVRREQLLDVELEDVEQAAKKFLMQGKESGVIIGTQAPSEWEVIKVE